MTYKPIWPKFRQVCNSAKALLQKRKLWLQTIIIAITQIFKLKNQQLQLGLRLHKI